MAGSLPPNVPKCSTKKMTTEPLPFIMLSAMVMWILQSSWLRLEHVSGNLIWLRYIQNNGRAQMTKKMTRPCHFGLVNNVEQCLSICNENLNFWSGKSNGTVWTWKFSGKEELPVQRLINTCKCYFFHSEQNDQENVLHLNNPIHDML